MPEAGIRYVPKKELLTAEEITRLITIFAQLGVTKIRLTGGEPFVRNDLMPVIREITSIHGIKDVHLTTNGILTAPHLPELKSLGIASVNLSLDTLDPQRYKMITRRDEFLKTRETFDLLIKLGIKVKLNTVVMDGKNIDDILPIVALTKDLPVSVRFIEEMPFNGEGNHYSSLRWTYNKILEHIQQAHPALQKIIDPENSTAYHYQIPGNVGTIGIIAAFSRTFCGTCNRIRLTAQGVLKTCLYDDGVLNIRDLIRAGASDDEIKIKLMQAFQSRPANGFEAEAARLNHAPVKESMSTIGG